MHTLVLASKSPRRKQILEERGYIFETLSLEVSEIPTENLNIKEQIHLWAKTKAQAAENELKPTKLKPYLVLSADTVVVFEEKIIGKPKTKEEARRTLGRLSSQSHHVYTAFCLLDCVTGESFVDSQESVVRFRALSDEAVETYIRSGRCMDKAGSYGIQEVGKEFVESFEGSYNNIVGLPIVSVEKALLEKGWSVAKKT